MIVLDTHIWIWWVNESSDLTPEALTVIQTHQPEGLVISAISVWEVAKLVERGRLTLTLPVEHWLSAALSYPGVRLLSLTPEIAVASTQLPQPFHKDPADQIIVATSRVLNAPLLTMDLAIRSYPNVNLAL